MNATQQTEVDLSDVYAFEAWQVGRDTIEFNLRKVEGDQTFTLTEAEAKQLVERLFEQYPNWRSEVGYRSTSHTE